MGGTASKEAELYRRIETERKCKIKKVEARKRAVGGTAKIAIKGTAKEDAVKKLYNREDNMLISYVKRDSEG